MARSANDNFLRTIGLTPVQQIRLDDDQVLRLMRGLRATLVKRKARDDTGQGVEYIEMKRSLDQNDLRHSTRFKQGDFAQLPGIRDEIEFTTPDGQRVIMAVARNGAFVFRRYTPESVIDYVLSAVERVLGRAAA